MPIPVICDRCRAVGTAGAEDFSHLGDLLEFTPVQRKTKRVDGWTDERQRAFVAALSVTGSRRRAAHAVGMAQYGVDQLLKADGSDSFRAACDRAMAIAAQNGTLRIASGVADAAARNAVMGPAPSRLRGHDPEPEADSAADEEKLALLERLFNKFARKVQAEREARLAGQIIAADFYLRQVTCLEIGFDLLAEGCGFDALQALTNLRRAGHGILAIAETDMSRMLDDARHQYWQSQGDPPRPEHPPRHLVEQRDGVTIDRSEHAIGLEAAERKEHSHDLLAQRARDANNQIKWEAKARRDYEARSTATKADDA